MKTEFISVLTSIAQFLENLGVAWKYVINGLIGATIWSIYKKDKFLTSVRQIIIGGVVAGYCTPILTTKINISLEYVGFTSFVIGMLGMVIIDSLYKYAVSNFSKWKEAFKIIFSNSK